MKVFVYGTLKSGYGNNYILSEGAHRKIGDAVVEGFKLYQYGFPVAKEDENSKAIGEVWDIGDNDATLARLDRLEGEGYMYHRKVVKAYVLGNQEEPLEVSMYVGGKHFPYTEMSECGVNENGCHLWQGRVVR